jgi:L-fuculose-phosphate aldolase
MTKNSSKKQKNGQLFPLFKNWGKELYRAGLVSATSGNLSLKKDKNIFITRTGSFLGMLKPADIIKVTLNKTCGNDRTASSELPAHRAVLCELPYQAVMHAHPAFTTVASLKFEKIEPVDLEGKYYFPEVPVIETELKPGAAELPSRLAAALKTNHIAVVRGHGVFGAGKDFAEAFALISSLEASCRILYLIK